MMRIDTPAELRSRPRVSVIVPCYRYGHFLPQAVSSALDQEGIDVDVLIVDDASPDQSAEVARDIASRDPRVAVLVHESNTGHIQTYNDGLRRATGDYTVLLSADDLLTPNSLTRAVQLMEAHPSVGLVYGPVVTFETTPPNIAATPPAHWAIWPGLEWAAELYRFGRNAIYSPEAVVRTSTMQAVGLYDPDHPHAGDLQMWLRIAAVADVGFIAGTTQALYRQHQTNMHSTVFASDQGAGMITDLQHRLSAFSTAAGRFADGEALVGSARKAEAIEAMNLASRAYVWGLTDQWPVRELVAFARECEPGIHATAAGRAYWRRAKLGPRLSHKNPAFVIRERVLSQRVRREQEVAARTGVGR